MSAYSPKDSSILIIDDDINLIRLMSQMLKDLGVFYSQPTAKWVFTSRKSKSQI